jgi:hypothetical protein
LGNVRAQVTKEKQRKLLLVEILARTLKQMIREKMRKKMTELKLPQTTPFLELAVHVFNMIFGKSPSSATFWQEEVKVQVLTHFPEALTKPEEGSPLESLIDVRSSSMLGVDRMLFVLHVCACACMCACARVVFLRLSCWCIIHSMRLWSSLVI